MPFWDGRIDELRVYARQRTEGELQTEELNYRAPRDFYGIGSRNSADVANQGPVAVPLNATAVVNQDTDVDVLVRCLEPEGQLLTLATVTNPVGGTASINAQKVRFRPSVAGVGRVTYEVRDPAGRSSSSSIVFTSSAA